MNDLLPCPFCGILPHQGMTKKGTCQLHGEPMQDYWIGCKHRHAHVQMCSRELAILEWNTRTQPSPAVEVTDAMLDAALSADQAAWLDTDEDSFELQRIGMRAAITAALLEMKK